MHIIEVIPITRRRTLDTLSYFHGESLEPGTLVSAPLGNKNINALVAGSKDAKDLKARIRSSDFSMKKIESVSEVKPLSEAFINASKKISEFYLTPLSKIFFEIISKDTLKFQKRVQAGKSKEPTAVSAVEGNAEDRLGVYETEIKKTLNADASVIFLCPTVHRAKKVFRKFNKEMETESVLFHSKLPKKKRESAWKRSHEDKKILLVGTAGILAASREDLGLVIIEEEASDAYRTFSNPSFDMGMFAEFLGTEAGARVVRGDLPLKSESFKKHETVSFATKPTQLEIAGLRQGGEEAEFEVITPKLKKVIVEGVEDGEKIFVYASSRGAGTLLCMDCGRSVVCKNCGAPVVLHDTDLLCHACGERRSAKETCIHCESWNLKEYGVGAETIERALLEFLPKEKVSRIDSDTAKKDKDAISTAKIWNESRGILVGTLKALPYVREVDLSVVASLESLMSFPGYASEEKALRIIFKLKEGSRRIFIQAHDPEHHLLSSVRSTDLNALHKEELQKREKFSYPPFATLIKVSVESESGQISENIKKLSSIIKDFDPIIYSTEPSRSRRHHGSNILLKISEGGWPNENLRKILAPLIQTFKIEVNPKNLF